MVGIDVKGLTDWLVRAGIAGLLAFALIGFQQGWWFFGRERDDLIARLEAMTKDRDEWKARALMGMQAAERATAAVLPAPEIAS